VRLPLLLATALAAAACDAGAGPAAEPGGARGIPAAGAERGRALFERKVGGLSCADCHSTTAEDQPDPARRRVGHTLADATRRPSWWHGDLDPEKGATVVDAAMACVARFQHRTWNGGLPLLPDGRRDLSKVEVPAADRDALLAFLESVSRPGPHPASPAKRDASRAAIARVEALTGDPARGRAVWAKACALCHGTGGSNTLGPSLRGDLAPDALRVIDYCRSGPTKSDRATADAWMPFFAPDSLPDQDLADVAALIDGGEW
jgi:mono/diheme cytochrome c family protein